MDRLGSFFKTSPWCVESFGLLNAQAAAECTENCSGRIKRSGMFGSKSWGGQEVSQLLGAAGGREPSRMSHLIISSFVSVFAALWDHTQVS